MVYPWKCKWQGCHTWHSNDIMIWPLHIPFIPSDLHSRRHIQLAYSRETNSMWHGTKKSKDWSERIPPWFNIPLQPNALLNYTSLAQFNIIRSTIASKKQWQRVVGWIPWSLVCIGWCSSSSSNNNSNNDQDNDIMAKYQDNGNCYNNVKRLVNAATMLVSPRIVEKMARQMTVTMYDDNSIISICQNGIREGQ